MTLLHRVPSRPRVLAEATGHTLDLLVNHREQLLVPGDLLQREDLREQHVVP